MSQGRFHFLAVRVLKPRQRKKRRGMAAIMMDVNFFKHYNDACGHREGDASLIRLVREPETALRPTDAEEKFIILLPGASSTASARGRNAAGTDPGARRSPYATPIADVVTVSIGVRSAQTP